MDTQTRSPKAISMYSRQPSIPQQVSVNRTTGVANEGAGLVSATSQASIPTGKFAIEKHRLEGAARFHISGSVGAREPAKRVVGAMVGLVAVVLAFLIVS